MTQFNCMKFFDGSQGDDFKLSEKLRGTFS